MRDSEDRLPHARRGFGLARVARAVQRSLLQRLGARGPPGVAVAVTRELVSQEAVFGHLRFAYGVLSVLAVGMFLGSMVDVEDVSQTVEDSIDAVVTVLTVLALVLLWRVHTSLARLARATRPLYRGDGVAVLHSPYLLRMVGEMVLWSLHTPPFVSQWAPAVRNLAFATGLKLYVIPVYINHRRFLSHPYCRALSAFSGIHLSAAFQMRTLFVHHTWKTALCVGLCVWMALSLMYGKAENVSVGNAMYWVFVTAGSIDLQPHTPAGRTVAVVAGFFGIAVVGCVVTAVQKSLALENDERTLVALLKVNATGRTIQRMAAVLLQRWFRLKLLQKRWATSGSCVRPVVTTAYAWRVTQSINAVREMRRQLHHSTNDIEASLQLAASRGRPSKPTTAEGLPASMDARLCRMEEHVARLRHALDATLSDVRKLAVDGDL